MKRDTLIFIFNPFLGRVLYSVKQTEKKDLILSNTFTKQTKETFLCGQRSLMEFAGNTS